MVESPVVESPVVESPVVEPVEPSLLVESPLVSSRVPAIDVEPVSGGLVVPGSTVVSLLVEVSVCESTSGSSPGQPDSTSVIMNGEASAILCLRVIEGEDTSMRCAIALAPAAGYSTS